MKEEALLYYVSSSDPFFMTMLTRIQSVHLMAFEALKSKKLLSRANRVHVGTLHAKCSDGYNATSLCFISMESQFFTV